MPVFLAEQCWFRPKNAYLADIMLVEWILESSPPKFFWFPFLVCNEQLLSLA